MSKVSFNRQLGGVLVVVGIEVGAGILALPILIAHLGFPLGVLLMFLAWALLTYTALLMAEVSLTMKDGVSFAGMAKELLGPAGQIMVWVSTLVLLYTIMAAYISAAGSSFHAAFNMSADSTSLLFVFLLGLFVVIGTGAVDWINRFLLGTKLALLIFSCLVLLPKINFNHLTYSFIHINYILSAIPIFVTTFTSHLIIPPLKSYLKSDKLALSRALVIGSLIPLVLYILWVFCIIGVIPFDGVNSFQLLFAKGASANVGDILVLMRENLNDNKFFTPIMTFTNISVTTSFLGVSLALFYFVIDGFRLNRLRNVYKNSLAVVLTFILPLLIVWYFPDVFIRALGLVGLCCSILLIIMPVYMLKSLDRRNHQYNIAITKSVGLKTIALIAGCIVVVIQVYCLINGS